MRPARAGSPAFRESWNKKDQKAPESRPKRKKRREFQPVLRVTIF
jgi:hypothetical protein